MAGCVCTEWAGRGGVTKKRGRGNSSLREKLQGLTGERGGTVQWTLRQSRQGGFKGEKKGCGGSKNFSRER